MAVKKKINKKNKSNGSTKTQYKSGQNKPTGSGMKKGYKYPFTYVRDLMQELADSGKYKTVEDLRAITMETLISKGLLNKSAKVAIETAQWIASNTNWFNEIKPEDRANPEGQQGHNGGVQILYFGNQPPQQLETGMMIKPQDNVSLPTSTSTNK